MIKLRLAIVAAVAGIFLMSSGSLVHAATDPYPVDTPSPTPSIAPDDDDVAPDDDDVAPDDDTANDDNGLLPNTGGSSIYILLAGGALLLVGGAIVYSTRRRQSSAH